MKEVKTPKKPLAIYYAIVLLVLMLLNFVLVPWMSERQVKEVDYGTFMSMTEDKDIGRVDVESNQIIFTDKDEKQIYKTGLMNDPDLFSLQLILHELLSAGSSNNATVGVGDVLVVEESLKYATVLVSIAPIMCVYPFLQKYFVKGVMIGAVKG